MLTGQVHSIESMGLVDGPGIRAVVFLQGCALRCRYCHNPDTWTHAGGTAMTPEALVNKLSRFKTYFDSSGGGVTFSGGEPLRQPEFLAKCLQLCKEAGIHTCIDTAGVGHGDYDAILEHTDLVLYDVKHFTPKGYRTVTGMEMEETLRFLEAVQRRGIPLWVRHVVVPGLTDGEDHIRALAQYVQTLQNVEKAELLGYHLLGREKYRVANIPYPLDGVPALPRAELDHYQTILNEILKGVSET